MERNFFFWGSFLGGLGVILGAFGAHILTGRLTQEMLITFEVGVKYQIYHALALLAAALRLQRQPSSKSIIRAGWSFIFGILIFSGSLYLLALTGIRWLGAVTPIGGTAFIVGWLFLMLSTRRNDQI